MRKKPVRQSGCAFVTSRGDGEDAIGVMGIESGLFRSALSPAAQAHADDIRASVRAAIGRVDQGR